MDVPIDVVIRSAKMIEPEALRLYAERRLTFVLHRFEHRTRRVIVRLADLNGPKKGIDARCSMTLQLRDGRQIEAEAVTSWPFASITLAAKRLSNALRRELERADAAVRRGGRTRARAFGASRRAVALSPLRWWQR